MLWGLQRFLQSFQCIVPLSKPNFVFIILDPAGLAAAHQKFGLRYMMQFKRQWLLFDYGMWAQNWVGVWGWERGGLALGHR